MAQCPRGKHANKQDCKNAVTLELIRREHHGRRQAITCAIAFTESWVGSVMATTTRSVKLKPLGTRGLVGLESLRHTLPVFEDNYSIPLGLCF